MTGGHRLISRRLLPAALTTKGSEMHEVDIAWVDTSF